MFNRNTRIIIALVICLIILSINNYSTLNALTTSVTIIRLLDCINFWMFYLKCDVTLENGMQDYRGNYRKDHKFNCNEDY